MKPEHEPVTYHLTINEARLLAAGNVAERDHVERHASNVANRIRRPVRVCDVHGRHCFFTLDAEGNRAPEPGEESAIDAETALEEVALASALRAIESGNRGEMAAAARELADVDPLPGDWHPLMRALRDGYAIDARAAHDHITLARRPRHADAAPPSTERSPDAARKARAGHVRITESIEKHVGQLYAAAKRARLPSLPARVPPAASHVGQDMPCDEIRDMLDLIERDLPGTQRDTREQIAEMVAFLRSEITPGTLVGDHRRG